MKLNDFLGGEVITAVCGTLGVWGVASVVSFGVDFNRNRFLGGKLCVIIEAAETLLCNLYGDELEPQPELEPEPKPEPLTELVAKLL